MIDRWDAVGSAGFITIVVGIGMMHIPSACIVAGLLLAAIGALYPILRGK